MSRVARTGRQVRVAWPGRASTSSTWTTRGRRFEPSSLIDPSLSRPPRPSLDGVEYLLLALVLIALVAFVAAPLRREREPQTADLERLRARVSELEARKEAKYREIRDAALDRAAGKLDDSDFAAVDAELRREAVAILKDLDAAEAKLRRARAV